MTENTNTFSCEIQLNTKTNNSETNVKKQQQENKTGMWNNTFGSSSEAKHQKFRSAASHLSRIVTVAKVGLDCDHCYQQSQLFLLDFFFFFSYFNAFTLMMMYFCSSVGRQHWPTIGLALWIFKKKRKLRRFQINQTKRKLWAATADPLIFAQHSWLSWR